jgi:hypothetical protein
MGPICSALGVMRARHRLVAAAFVLLAAAVLALPGTAASSDNASGPASSDATVGAWTPFWTAHAAQGATATRLAAPTVDPSGPVATVKAPLTSCSASTTASFAVSWSCAPALPSGGYDAVRVEYLESGRGRWLVWKSATTTASALFPGVPGHTYVFRVAAAKSADPATVGPWSAEVAATVPFDETALTYSAGWTKSAPSGAYRGTVRSSATKGRSATFAFTGTSLVLVAPRAKSLGKVAVYVRTKSASTWGAYKLVKTVDLYARTAKARVVTNLVTWATAEQRQAKLVVTGAKNRASSGVKVSVDGLAVRDAIVALPQLRVNIDPPAPQVEILGQLQLSATVSGSVNQDVTWELYVSKTVDWTPPELPTLSTQGLFTATQWPTQTAMNYPHYVEYRVVARSVADPDQVAGMVDVAVVPSPAPSLTSVSPSRPMPLQPTYTEGYGPEGSTVTLTGSHFVSHGVGPEVMVCGLWADVTSYSDTSISVRVPSGYVTHRDSTSGYIYVKVRDQGSNSLYFTVTGILPQPPSLWAKGINAESTDDDNASVGDELRIYGTGFSSVAANNVIRFGTVEAAASRYQQDAYWPDEGTVWVTVPPGAQTAALAAKRLDGKQAWYTDGPVLTIVPKTEVTIAPAPAFAAGFVNAYYPRVGGGTYPDSWMLTGTNFMKLRVDSMSVAGTFALDVTVGGQTSSTTMRALSDTLAVQSGVYGGPGGQPAAFAGVDPGDTVQLRVRGLELTNYYERSSGSVAIACRDRAVFGGVSYVDLGSTQTAIGPFSKGDILAVRSSDALLHRATSSLWPGVLPIGTGGAEAKLVPLSVSGAYTVSDSATGRTYTFTVKEGGVYGAQSYGYEWQPDLRTNGAFVRAGGVTVDIPAGALSAADLGTASRFSLYVSHDPSSLDPFDPVLTDGGGTFTVNIGPEPRQLLKPIVITLPYDPAGRQSPPFCGLWDDGSQLYYDFGLDPAAVDTVNHTVTLVLPAGDYSGTGGTKAAAGVAAKAAAPAWPPPSPPPAPANLPTVHFNSLVERLGTVSTDKVSYLYEDVTRKIRVNAVNDPASTSYISAAQASAVLATAVVTYDNLEAKGWSVPDDWIVLYVRDYGPPTAYQGATTKAVFGQPWVYINSQVVTKASVAVRDTAVSHEMGHVFQRQLTTNISTKWIDEATAEWVAFDTLGAGGSDFREQIKTGSDFPKLGIPSGFYAGYSTEHAYAAGALAIWLARTYGAASILGVYDHLAYNPAAWYDSYGTITTATGATMPAIVEGFARDYWLQKYEPVKSALMFSMGVETFGTYAGTSFADSRPAYSSARWDVGASAAFRTDLSPYTMVLRVAGLGPDQFVEVYSDTNAVGATPAAPTLVATATSVKPELVLGAYGAIGCYRMLVVNRASDVAAGLSFSLVPVRVDAVAPANASKNGGTSVTVSGRGFRARGPSSTLMVGPAIVQGAAITNWTDTSITFTMPSMGGFTGAQPLSVRADYGSQGTVTSNTATITVDP